MVEEGSRDSKLCKKMINIQDIVFLSMINIIYVILYKHGTNKREEAEV